MDLEILKIASNTENYKILKEHTHNSKQKNPICGDEMQISILIKNDSLIVKLMLLPPQIYQLVYPNKPLHNVTYLWHSAWRSKL